VAVAPVLVVVTLSGLLALGPAVAATNVPRDHLGMGTPADFGLDHADVAFETSDGVELSGWYLPSQTGAAVVLLHGAGSTRSAVLDHAVVLARSGFGVLLLDARGHGQSGGDAMDFGWHGDQDVAAAVSYLETRPDVDESRIGAVGLSMGGEQALGALGSDPRLRAVVAEGATGRVAQDRAWMPDEYGLRGWIQQRLDWITFQTADLLTSARPPDSLRASVATAGRPVLLITAGDVPDEAVAARFIASGAPSTVEIWQVAGTGHTGALGTQPVEWKQRVVAFLRTTLAASHTSSAEYGAAGWRIPASPTSWAW
jgi:dienelactone hydrolase